MLRKYPASYRLKKNRRIKNLMSWLGRRWAGKIKSGEWHRGLVDLEISRRAWLSHLLLHWPGIVFRRWLHYRLSDEHDVDRGIQKENRWSFLPQICWLQDFGGHPHVQLIRHRSRQVHSDTDELWLQGVRHHQTESDEDHQFCDGYCKADWQDCDHRGRDLNYVLHQLRQSHHLLEDPRAQVQEQSAAIGAEWETRVGRLLEGLVNSAGLNDRYVFYRQDFLLNAEQLLWTEWVSV